QIIERLSGKRLRQFASERIFAPLGMSGTLFRDDASLVIPGRAYGYIKRPDESWAVAEYTLSSVGPGGVYSTINDMARWASALDQGRTEPADLDARLRRTRPLLGGGENNYACGLVVEELYGRRC